jgi:hypothetical protein
MKFILIIGIAFWGNLPKQYRCQLTAMVLPDLRMEQNDAASKVLSLPFKRKKAARIY